MMTDLENRVEGLEKQMAGVYDILDKVADSDKASVDLFKTLTDKVMKLEKSCLLLEDAVYNLSGSDVNKQAKTYEAENLIKKYVNEEDAHD